MGYNMCPFVSGLSPSVMFSRFILVAYLRVSILFTRVSVAQSCPTLCDPMNCSPPGFSVHGMVQARILEWVAIPLSRGSSQPRDQTLVSCIAGRLFTVWATGKSFFMAEYYSTVGIDNVSFIHSSVGAHFNGFCLLSVVSNGAVRTAAQISIIEPQHSSGVFT